MRVVATAGHVDHGKSTLVRALTGIEPDRWAEERRRGLTIDLGFAWTTLPSGTEVGFVDVPGHERFLGNMLAGIGPAPVVCLVVAADEGWRAQSDDHRDAVAALGIEHGVIVVSRADLAPDAVPAVVARAREELAGTGLRDAPAVAVSAVTGAGLDELRHTLEQVLAQAEAPDPTARVRLWVDRAFTITGAGTVVTGTLPAGTVSVGDRLELFTGAGTRELTVRGIQRHGGALDSAGPVSRLAVNLRGLKAEDVGRGDTLLSPGAWWRSAVLDVRRVSGPPLREAPEQLVVHLGTAAVPARVRPFDDDHARLTLAHPLPLVHGDRGVLRDPGSHRALTGVVALDVDPPTLRRRGSARARAEVLAGLPGEGDVRQEVARRGAARVRDLELLGLVPADGSVPPGITVTEGWWVDEARVQGWRDRLGILLREHERRHPLSAGLSTGAARDALGLPDAALLPHVAAAAGVDHDGRHVRTSDRQDLLGPAEAPVAALEARLRAEPFRAPEADDLTGLGLGARELAAAERAGRLIRLDGGVVLLPSAPALAMRTLSGLDQPFTTSQARQALGVSRRVAIPLLEHLDGRGWTRRVDGTHRVVVRG